MCGEDWSRSEDYEGDAIYCPTYDNGWPTAASEDRIGSPGTGEHQDNDDRGKASSIIIWSTCQPRRARLSIDENVVRTDLWDRERAWLLFIPRLKP